MTEAEAGDIKRLFFPNHRGAELKHVNLSRRSAGRASVLEFLRWLSANQNRLAFGYMHKEYALLAKMVDWVLEPSFRALGHDLYERGANIGLVNLTYTIVRSTAGPDYLRELLRAFQDLVLEPSSDHLDKFERILNERDEPEPLREVLGYYRLALAHLGSDLLEILHPSHLDLVLSLSLGVMAEWSERGDAPFRVIQDQCSEMARDKVVWAAVTSPDVPQQLVGWDRRTISYPIGIESTELASSHDWIGLQLADVVAGAVARAMRSSPHALGHADPYSSDILAAIGEWTCSNNLWPSSVIDPVKLGTVGPMHRDANEHVEDLVRKARL
jgi:hypothetical protein